MSIEKFTEKFDFLFIGHGIAVINGGFAVHNRDRMDMRSLPKNRFIGRKTA